MKQSPEGECSDLLTNSLNYSQRKCIKVCLENWYVDIRAKRTLKNVWKSKMASGDFSFFFPSKSSQFSDTSLASSNSQGLQVSWVEEF